jgi:mannose-1-phosphate guanylyltransferase
MPNRQGAQAEPPRAQILEPIGRNTAPAIAVAALALERPDPDAIMLVLPADHPIHDVEALRSFRRGRHVRLEDVYSGSG